MTWKHLQNIMDPCLLEFYHFSSVYVMIIRVHVIYKIHLFSVADIAFVDRADIKAYVGPPTHQARYEILKSCLEELLRTGILSYSQMQVCIDD